MENAIEKAARLAGNRTALANLVGVTPQAVQQWVKRGLAPAKRCLRIEAVLDSAVTRFDLRPDLFGAAPEAAPPTKATP
ncbi:transcriptional regulator [Duganella sp. CT11-25]|uniref:transcriptional regulator n=1 Tax=unclassified Duganella TaxID=2636909 RepID=UPI0039B08801